LQFALKNEQFDLLSVPAGHNAKLADNPTQDQGRQSEAVTRK